MRYTKFFCFLFMMVLAVSAFSKQPKDKNKYGVYLAGVSASFTDSLVYFTGVQYLDSASVDGKGLLVGRALYSIQLKDYLEQKQNGKNRTCFIFFSRKKKNVQKELKKMKERYAKGSSLVLQDVNAEFKFEKLDFE